VTNVDKALLLAEWVLFSTNRDDRSCPCCEETHWVGTTAPMGGVASHAVGCPMDLALSERGFFTQAERDRARDFIRTGAAATAPTLPPPEHEGD